MMTLLLEQPYERRESAWWCLLGAFAMMKFAREKEEKERRRLDQEHEGGLLRSVHISSAYLTTLLNNTANDTMSLTDREIAETRRIVQAAIKNGTAE